MADELTGLPAPWDTQAYQIGNYPGAAFTNEMLYTEDQKMENEDYAAARESADAVYKSYNESLETAERLADQKYPSNTGVTDDAREEYINTLREPYLQAAYAATDNIVEINSKLFPGTVINPPDTSDGIFGIGYDGEDFSFGEQSKGSGGTYATAAGNIQKDVFDAYKNQALKSLGVDTLLDEMGKLPGAPIIAGFLTSLPCKPTPLWAFDPRLDSFMNTIEFDFCQVGDGKVFDITAPKWAGAKVGWSNIWKAFREALEEVIKSLLVKLAILAIKAILKWILNLACDSLALLGAGLGDLLTGSDKFSDLLANGLCPDEDPETVNGALLDLFNTLGGLDASCLSGVTGDEMGRLYR